MELLHFPFVEFSLLVGIPDPSGLIEQFLFIMDFILLFLVLFHLSAVDHLIVLLGHVLFFLMFLIPVKCYGVEIVLIFAVI